ARVVVHIRNDQSRSDHGQKKHDAPPERTNDIANSLDSFRPAFAHHLEASPAPHSVRVPYFRSFETTSSTVMTPRGRPSSSTTVNILRLYLSNSSNTSFSSAFGGKLKSGSILSSPRV